MFFKKFFLAKFKSITKNIPLNRQTRYIIGSLSKTISSAKGYTIVELVVTLIITAILFTLSTATININNSLEMRVRLAARQLQSHIRYIQKIAMVTRTRTGILFLTESMPEAVGVGKNNYQGWIEETSDQQVPYQSWTWFPLTDPSTNKEMRVCFSDYKLASGTILEKALTQFAGVKITKTGFSPGTGAGNLLWFLIFDPNGRPYSYTWWPGSPGVVELDDDSYVRFNNMLDVVVEPRTGFVSLRPK